MVVINILIP